MRRHSWLLGPALILLICGGFYWKLLLTNEYTWLDDPDIAYQVLPWLQFQASEWHHGRVPLWDPHLWGGQSLIGQAQPGVVYPLNLLLFSLPLEHGRIRQVSLHWYFVVIHMMAALFCYWLCRDLKLSRAGSLMGGVAFALGGYVGATAWPQMINGAVWAPLVFLFLLRAVRGEHRVSSAALSGLFLGTAWLSGHHQIPIYLTIASVAIWTVHFLREGRPDWRILRLASIFTLFLVLVSAIQVLPAYEYGKLARRWVGTDQPLAWHEPVPYTVHKTFSLTPTSLLGILAPGFSRNADPFVSVVAVSLALLGVALGWRHSAVRLFGGLAVAGLLISLGGMSVLHGLLYAVLPLVEKARNPSMAVVLYHLGVSVLAAVGITELSSHRESAWLRRTAIALVLVGASFWAVLVLLDLAGVTLPETRFAVVGLVALVEAAALYAWVAGHIRQGVLVGLLFAAMLVELGNVSGFSYPSHRDTKQILYSKLLSQHDDIAGFLRFRAEPVRIWVSSQDIPYNFGDWQGIDVFGGYVASLPSDLLHLGLNERQVWDLFGVNYVIARSPARPEYQEVFRGASGLNVYRNPNAFPRAWAEHGRSPCPAPDHVSLVSRTSGSVAIDANLGCRATVVVGENYFPGWQASVDGKPAEIREVHGTLRGVRAGPGRHRIEMRYRPLSVLLGALMTFAGLAGAVALAVLDRRRPMWNYR